MSEEEKEEGMSEEGIERLDDLLSNRSVRALSIVLNGDIEMLPRRGAKVYSQNGGGTYRVTGDFCTCPDFQYNDGNICKHIRAYRITKSLQKADRESALD